MPRIPGIDRKKAYGKTKDIAQKFDVAAVGNLADSRIARMVERLSWLLHHPKLPPMFDEEWAEFCKRAKSAIADGDADFFADCAAMVLLIKRRMSRISVDERIDLSDVSKKQPAVRRLVHWMMGKEVDDLGQALLSTLLNLARNHDASAKFTLPQVMQALARSHPEHADCDEKHVREVLKLMKVGGFPIHAAPFKELFRVAPKSRKEKAKKG